MTPNLEATLRAALERATAGDWLAEPADMFGDHNIILAESEDMRAVAAVVSNMRSEDEVEANAAFIALAKNHMGDLLDTLTALRAQVEALGWYQMDSAPKDGTPFQALIPGHGADNIITWTDGLLDSNGEDCGAWVFASEQEPPDDWTDGYCWEVNEDGVPSTKPVLWRPLPATLEPSRG